MKRKKIKLEDERWEIENYIWAVVDKDISEEEAIEGIKRIKIKEAINQ